MVSTKPDSHHDQSPSRLRRVARDLWIHVALRPYRNISIIGLVVMAVILLGYGSKRITAERAAEQSTAGLLNEILALLDQGHIEEARSLAADLRLHDDIPASERGLPPYVLGLAMHHDAMQMDPEEIGRRSERKALYLLAANYFDEARSSGFPPGQEARGVYLLGKSLHHCGRFGEAIPHLRAAAEKLPAQASQCQSWLTDCFLKSKTPDFEQARQSSERYLSDPNLSPRDRDRSMLQHARILFELGRRDECQQTIAAISSDSPHYGSAMLLSGRLLLAEGDALHAKSTEGIPSQEALDKYARAKQAFLDAQHHDDRTSEFRSQAQYLLALVHRRLGETTEALELFSRTQRAYLDSAEGIAAGLEEAELFHELGNDKEALASYGRSLRQAAQMKIDARPWLTSDQIRARVERTLEIYRSEEEFAHAAELVRSLMSLFPDARTTQLAARLHEQWAKQLALSAAAPGGSENSTVMEQARSEFREAGRFYQQLGRLRFATREYPRDLWNSAENYQLGHDYPSAVTMYTHYLQHQAQAGRPAGLLRLGESYLALNDTDKALKCLNECIDMFPKDPFVYSARIAAAEANVELENRERAKELLVANLENGSLTPQSSEWRQSLFSLGRIHFQEGMHHETQSRAKGVDSFIASERQEGMKELKRAEAAFDECIQRLAESIQRDPDSEQALEARYMLAQAHLQTAKLPKKELATVNIEATRVLLRREMQDDLRAAADAFELLKGKLNTLEGSRALTATEQRMLRNCYFGRADALFDLGQYEDAIQAYSSATTRYQHEPEALEAYVQIAICHRKLRRPVDSRRTLDQAKAVLTRIRPDADFLVTTRYDRNEWNDLLNWLSTL